MLKKPLEVASGLSSPDRARVIVMSLAVWGFDVSHPEGSAEKLVTLKNHFDAVLVTMLLSCNFRVFVEAKYVHNAFMVAVNYSSSRVFFLFFSKGSISYS